MSTKLPEILTQKVNVHPLERVVAFVLAFVLLGSAWRHRGSRLAVLAAACCFYRAGSGNCKGYQMLGISTCPLPEKKS